ncbi:hypothetical protein D3C81_1650850 [compost metagenome]
MHLVNDRVLVPEGVIDKCGRARFLRHCRFLLEGFFDAPDPEWQVPGFDAHPLRLAIPGPAVAAHQVFTVGGGVVVQAQFPQRQFEMGLLGGMRVEADGHQDEIAAVGRALAEVQDVVVPHVVELDAQVRLQGRVLPADAIELGNFGNDVARSAEVPRANLVLL